MQIINEKIIEQNLAAVKREDHGQIRDILAKAQTLQGLNLADAAVLSKVTNPELLQEIFAVANQVKNEIYGNRLVIFAPLYISNLCDNECAYCAFRSANQSLRRRFLSQDEIANEVGYLVDQGQKRLLLVAGEADLPNGIQYFLDAIATTYRVKSKHGAIRRLNVNIAPLALEDYKRLKAAQIGTYILFQETYHRETYKQVHLSGKKADYDWRITAFDRAMQAEIDDVGLGALFGLYDWRFEVLALLQHAEYLQNCYGVGPHTISVPRLEPAAGSLIASHPLAPVSDIDFCKLIAILRLAVPYTGIIMSTRETPELRRQTFALGVSQISAGSRTAPGGYADFDADTASQFSLGDHRSLDEVVRDVASLGYIPSFCTACYRSGRTGEDFMHLARPGKIKAICAPNAAITFAEYLLDYATPATKEVGIKLLQSELHKMPEYQRNLTEKILARIHSGERDIYI